MKRTMLLDCTLRDGGYINDWNFGQKAIDDIAWGIGESDIDIIELGFLKDEPYTTDRVVFNSMEQVKKIIGEKRPGLQYAVMAEVVNPLPLEMIAPADNESADIIRVIVWKTKRLQDGSEVDALQDGFAYCKGIVERGYKLCVQPARVDQYSDEEFVRMVQMFQQLNPLAIYVVDSWGTQNAEELLHYMHLADDIMNPGICLGYHGHNNMMQALNVAQTMMKEDFERDLIIDASIYGIGRGAGNLNLEMIAQHMNEHCGGNYRVGPILEVFEKHISPIYKQEAWGYSVPLYLTAAYNCNPNYAKYLKNELELSNSDILLVLQQLKERDKIGVSKKKVSEILKGIYAFDKNQLCIVIPTANRAEIIRDILNKTIQDCVDCGVDVVIFDSSDTADTKNVVIAMNEKGYHNLSYQYYKNDDSISLDNKVMEAYRRMCNNYEYIWIIRDRLIIKFDECIKSLKSAFSQKKDIISIHNINDECRSIGNRVYNKASDLLKDQFPYMTVLGQSIFRGKFISKVLENEPLDMKKNYALWQPIAIFDFISSNDFSAVSISGTHLFEYHPSASNGSFWLKFHLWQWVERFYLVMCSLPTTYDTVKMQATKDMQTVFGLLSPIYLCSISEKGYLKIADINKYKNIIPKVTETPIYFFYIISITPRFLLRILIQKPNTLFARFIKKLSRILRGVF